MMRTLLLTPWMAPHRVIPWERAVVRLRKAIGAKKHAVRFSRINVYTRDGFHCQYCGEKKGMRDLNYDHVVPRVRGGKTVWENIVTSCYACNDRKGSRTPEEAGMTLRKKPFKPSSLPVTPVLPMRRVEMPEAWLPYCDRPASERVA